MTVWHSDSDEGLPLGVNMYMILYNSQHYRGIMLMFYIGIYIQDRTIKLQLYVTILTKNLKG